MRAIFLIIIKQISFKNTVKQEVTGIIVNGKKLSISKHKRDNLRFILNVWQKYGIEKAIEKYKIIYKNENCNVYNFITIIKGHISFIKNINKAQGEKLENKYKKAINTSF